MPNLYRVSQKIKLMQLPLPATKHNLNRGIRFRRKHTTLDPNQLHDLAKKLPQNTDTVLRDSYSWVKV